MNTYFPIYNLLHQDIRACANHLIEMGQHDACSLEEHANHIFSRLSELHQFALKIHPEEHYYPLRDFKFYLENTMLSYEDISEKLHTMRLSEALSLLGVKESPFDPKIVDSLKRHFIKYFYRESQPGKPLFAKLVALNKI